MCVPCVAHEGLIYKDHHPHTATGPSLATPKQPKDNKQPSGTAETEPLSLQTMCEPLKSPSKKKTPEPVSTQPRKDTWEHEENQPYFSVEGAMQCRQLTRVRCPLQGRSPTKVPRYRIPTLLQTEEDSGEVGVPCSPV